MGLSRFVCYPESTPFYKLTLKSLTGTGGCVSSYAVLTPPIDARRCDPKRLLSPNQTD